MQASGANNIFVIQCYCIVKDFDEVYYAYNKYNISQPFQIIKLDKTGYS